MRHMLHGFHAIVSTYGFWLPNDPRGSWSDFVRRWELTRFGKATKVSTRGSMAVVKHDVDQRKAAKRSLMFPEVVLTGKQALSVARGFAAAVEESDYQVFACSILPQHIHLVVGPHATNIRRAIGHLKGRATQRLVADGLHPLASYRQKDGTLPSLWARNSWIVYVFSEEHLLQAIRYVNQNPLKEGKKPQNWTFVRAYSLH
jgi:REP element-mobilizing transposase RayT